MDIKELLAKYEFDNVDELYEYINYLEVVRIDYEHLKAKIKNISLEINNLY